MKRIISAALWLLAMGGAYAQGIQVKGVVGGGLTFGGDTVATVQYTGGEDDANVHAGGLVAFNAGVEVRFTDLVSAQALVGYHVDRANGSNGNVRFERYPLELLGHFRLNNWVRLGGGLRYINRATVRASGAGQNFATDEDFKPSVGSVVEAEFFPVQSFGIKLRYVHETFKSDNHPEYVDLDGSHGGVYFNFYF